MLDHRKIRALRHVYRFNFHHVNSRQNVAEHSFYVSIYAGEFAKIIFKNDSFLVAQTVKRALEHDFEEAIIGDISFLVRRQLSFDTLLKLNNKAMVELGIPEEDFENNAEGWTLGSGWQLTTDEANSPTHSMNSPNDDSTLNGTYDMLSPVLTLPQLGDGETMNFRFYICQ